MSHRLPILLGGIFLSLLIWSGLFFSAWTPVAAQSVTDDERMKERLARIHAQYTGRGDHDQFLHKLQQAQNKTDSFPVRDALGQIIVWREEMRPPKLAAGSSIQQVAATSTSAGVVAKQPSWVEQVKLVPTTSNDRYQLNGWYIDLTVLQTTWLQRVNELRASRGRHALTLHPVLHKTAADRSEAMKQKGVADHKRFSSSAYYAYGELVNWFADRGVVFENVSRATFTENIGWAPFRCKQQDCTQTAIDAMRTTFDFYVSEEWTTNDAHWRTIIHPLFEIVGLGIAVNESTNKFYLTTHYGTQIK
jgi:uncharacterized protein YkwD